MSRTRWFIIDHGEHLQAPTGSRVFVTTAAMVVEIETPLPTLGRQPSPDDRMQQLQVAVENALLREGARVLKDGVEALAKEANDE